MARKQQLTVALENKLGQLARLSGVLKRAKVNIEAISVTDSSDVAAVHLLVDSTSRARAALAKAGMLVTAQSVLAVKLPNEPGALASAAGKLSRARVNVKYVYGSSRAKGKPTTVVFGVDDVAKAEKALK